MNILKMNIAAEEAPKRRKAAGIAKTGAKKTKKRRAAKATNSRTAGSGRRAGTAGKKPARRPARKPAEPSITEKPAEQPIEEKPVEQPAATKPVEKPKSSLKRMAEALMAQSMPPQPEIIRVAYTVDIQGAGAQPFVNQLLASVASVVKNGAVPGRDKVKVTVFYGHLDENTRRTLNGMSNENVLVETAGLREEDLAFMQQFTDNDPTASVRTWSGIVFVRIWLPIYVKDAARCIYLDTDTLVRKPLRPLWDFDLGGKALGMAMGSVFENGYNSGVMLMDLKKLDTQENWKALHEHMAANARRYTYPDQTVINQFYRDEIAEMPQAFNYPPSVGVAYSKACDDAVVWHFYNGGTKPQLYSEFDWCRQEWNSYFSRPVPA